MPPPLDLPCASRLLTFSLRSCPLHRWLLLRGFGRGCSYSSCECESALLSSKIRTPCALMLLYSLLQGLSHLQGLLASRCGFDLLHLGFQAFQQSVLPRLCIQFDVGSMSAATIDSGRVQTFARFTCLQGLGRWRCIVKL